MAMKVVLQLPPKLSSRMRVNLESLDQQRIPKGRVCPKPMLRKQQIIFAKVLRGRAGILLRQACRCHLS